MIDDDVSTLLKLDARGVHAGGTIQAGARPVFVASGGVTVNPPDVSAARDAIRTFLDDVREAAPAAIAATPGAIASAIPDLAARAPDLVAALPDVSAAATELRDAAPVAARSLRGAARRFAAAVGDRAPDARTRSRLVRDAEQEARRVLHLAPRRRSLVERMPGGLPLVLALGAAAVAAVGIAVLADADRRRRLRDRLDRLVRRSETSDAGRTDLSTVASPSAGPSRPPIGIPIERDVEPIPLARPNATRSVAP